MGKKKQNIKHYRNTKKFLQQILRNDDEEQKPSDDREVSYKWGRIPEELLAEEDIKAHQFSFSLSGALLKAFDDVLQELRNDSETEHLADEVLQNKLWLVTCDIHMKRKFYANHRAEFEERIKKFLEELYRPIDEYFVIFEILNFDLQTPPIQILDTVILKATQEELVNRGFNPDQENHEKVFRTCENKTVMLVTVFGENKDLIIEQAKKKAYFVLRTLQLNLSDSYVFEDKYLLFEISTHIILKTDDCITHKWEEKRDPCCLVYNQAKSSPNFIKALSHIELTKNIPIEARAAVERAVLWIGKAISEPELDIKVTFLCTAMEALLTTQQDGRKGQAIAYRMVLLHSLLNPGEGFTDPFKVFWIYDELRSSVVHGSAIFVATKRDYKSMRYAARETLFDFISAVDRFNIKSVSKLINLLDTSEEIEEMRGWCERFIKPLVKVGKHKTKYF